MIYGIWPLYFAFNDPTSRDHQYIILGNLFVNELNFVFQQSGFLA